MNESNTNKKCKNNNDTAMHGKKTKSTSRPLSKEDFEHTKKENLCFLYMGDHPKKDFPSLKKLGPSKDKKVHTMQVLPLELSSQYSQVEVSHMDVMHESHLTSYTWQPKFGPHDLVRMHGVINGHKVHIIIDDGALHNFLNYKLLKKLKLHQISSNHVYKVEIITALESKVWDSYVANVDLFTQGHTTTLNF